MKIEITWENIGEGGHSACDCPVFRALVDAGYPRAMVKQSSFTLDFDGRYPNWYQWPPEISDWIRRYDLRESIEPIRCEFNLTEKP